MQARARVCEENKLELEEKMQQKEFKVLIHIYIDK